VVASWLPRHDGFAQHAIATGEPSNGRMAFAARDCTVGRPTGHTAACPPRLALATVAPRPPLRPGPTHRRRLAPRRRTRPRLQALLLLPRSTRTPDPLRRLAVAPPGRRRRRSR